ncbi:branched-chain-amino-acid transaminase [Phycisphaerales bacterium AB-hyl4]|uniref:Branched-chain-amino-acid aminotransferase n=1 Tax=Natronomicrosphaera hydrolytica TaxID=3242702 RepID=A0ABV4U4X3_9BACT
MSKRIWLNGKLVPPEQATVNVYDHGLLYGDGVFEGIRAYNGRVFKLRTHLRRLYESAVAIRLEIPYTIDELAEAVRETIAANDRQDGYIRLCVTRGVGTLGLNPFTCEAPNVFIIVDSIKLYPAELYEQGMEIVTASTVRNHPMALSPRIKSMNYLNNILAKIEALDAGVMEAVMLNHLGYVAECTGDNIFIVRKRDGQPVVYSPPLHAGVLEGITMRAVEGLARDAGLCLERVDLTRYDLYTADEMFLTGTAAEVIPVTKVDGRVIGDGKPGKVTLSLFDAFHKLVQNNAPED